MSIHLANFLDLFARLEMPVPQSSEGVRLTALPIPGFERHRLGKDLQGSPVLLLSTVEAIGQFRPAPIELEHLVVQHDIECRISRPDGSVEAGRFSVIRCPTGDGALQEYFLTVAAPIVMLVGAAPSAHDVSNAIERFIELFRQLTEPSRKSVQGLWAELFCIARTREPAIMLSSWHQSPEALYDFSAGNQRLEVKSASGGVRRHYFALAQLKPSTGTEALYASLFVERAGGGTSVMQLADRIRGQIGASPELLLHLDRIIGLTLGNNWRAAIEDRFDQELAAQSLAFFEADVIPSVNPELPPGVSDVRFRSDLSGCTSADLRAYRSQGGLFRAALRR